VTPLVRELVDERRRRWDGDGPRPVRTHVWSPPEVLEPVSLVLVSHGSGGSAWQMTWVAEPVARAGFLVARSTITATTPPTDTSPKDSPSGGRARST
jgi:predicted dienelactone hydrolase